MTQKKITTIAVIAVIAIVAVPLILLFYNQAKQSQIAKEEKPLIGESHVDAVSGETLTESTRNHDPASQVLTLVGFNNLLDLGLGMDQYSQLEEKFNLLNDKMETRITRASMYKGSAEKTYRDEKDSRVWLINFDMQLNQEDDYAATIEYTSLTTMTLKVYTKDRSKLLYTL